MNGSYQLLKFLSRVCCRLSDRSAVKMGHILGEFFGCLSPTVEKIGTAKYLSWEHHEGCKNGGRNI